MERAWQLKGIGDEINEIPKGIWCDTEQLDLKKWCHERLILYIISRNRSPRSNLEILRAVGA